MYVVCGQVRHETTEKDDKKESYSEKKSVTFTLLARIWVHKEIFAPQQSVPHDF